jgi:hypothetical protein
MSSQTNVSTYVGRPSSSPRKPSIPHMDASEPNRRLRYGQLPVPAERADLYWGVNQPELRDLTDAQLTALLIATPEFQALLEPKLTEIDARNQTVGSGKSMGRPNRWSALQVESFLLYRRIAGLETIKRTCERLHWDSEARHLLDLGERLPSRATISRYVNQHFDASERVSLYRELDRRLRQRVVQLPGFDIEARIIGLDGSKHGTRYTPPIPERGKNGKLTKKLLNGHLKPGAPGSITAPDAGYVGGNHPKSGRGWQLMGLFTEHGTLIAWDISPLNEGERVAAERVLSQYEREILPHRGPQTLSICTADGGFSSPVLRSRLQDLRVVPNIHRASHGRTPKTQRNVAKLDADWQRFEHPDKKHYANWQANGHMELRCACRAGVLKRVFEVSKAGYLSIAVKGQCGKCGNVTITAGKWRRAQNPTRYVRAFAQHHGEPALGNGLTYKDRLSRKYGKGRFGWGESVHATLERRFGLLQDKSGMRSKVQVETEFAIAASAISVLLLERHARQGGSGTEFNASRPAQIQNNAQAAELADAA